MGDRHITSLLSQLWLLRTCLVEIAFASPLVTISGLCFCDFRQTILPSHQPCWLRGHCSILLLSLSSGPAAACSPCSAVNDDREEERCKGISLSAHSLHSTAHGQRCGGQSQRGDGPSTECAGQDIRAPAYQCRAANGQRQVSLGWHEELTGLEGSRVLEGLLDISSNTPLRPWYPADCAAVPDADNWLQQTARCEEKSAGSMKLCRTNALAAARSTNI